MDHAPDVRAEDPAPETNRVTPGDVGRLVLSAVSAVFLAGGTVHFLFGEARFGPLLGAACAYYGAHAAMRTAGMLRRMLTPATAGAP